MAQAASRFYQPTITRLPSLICLLLATIALIILTELACRRLPALETNGMAKIMKNIEGSGLQERNASPMAQEEALTPSESTVPVTAATIAKASASTGPSLHLARSSETSTATSGAYLPLARSSETSTAISGAYLPLAPSSEISTASSAAYLPIGPSVASYAITSAYLPLEPTDAILPTASEGAGPSIEPSFLPYPTRSAYLPLEPSTAPISTAAESAYLPIESQSLPMQSLSSSAYLPLSATTEAAKPSAFLSLDASTIVADGGPDPTFYLPLGSTSVFPIKPSETGAAMDVLSSARASNNQYTSASVSTTAPAAISANAGPAQAHSAADISQLTLISAASGFYLPLDTFSTLFGSSDSRSYAKSITSMAEVSTIPIPEQQASPTRSGFVDGMPFVIGNGTIYIDGTSYATATPTTATLHHGDVLMINSSGAITFHSPSAKTPGDNSNDVDHQDHVISVTATQYIIGAFVPTILAVVFSIPWHLLAAALQEMEPFYQMQRPGGASALSSLLLDYKSSINLIATFNAMKSGHFLVWGSGLISLAVLLLAPLASETVFIGFLGQGVCTATSGRLACIPRLSVYPTAARVIQGILALVAVLTLALVVGISRKRTGVYSNPRSIAGIASLFQNPSLIEKARHADPYARKFLRRAFEDQRYKIGSYKAYDGGNLYGMMAYYSSADIYDGEERVNHRDGKKYASVAITAADEYIPSHVQAQLTRSSSDLLMHPVGILVFGLLVAGLEVLVIYYNKTGGDTGFERFMDSNSFGVAFLFTAVGVGINLYWTLLDDGLRAIEPWRQLLRGCAPASDSILLAPESNPFTGFYYSFQHGHYLNAYFSLVAILCEFLIIALANIPFKPGLAFIAYKACTYIAIAILSLMLIGLIWIISMKRSPGLMARKPEKLAEVMIALCGSQMLEDFEGMSTIGTRERDVIVNGWRKKYSMGTLIGLDGVERRGVDEDLFVSHDCASGDFETRRS